MKYRCTGLIISCLLSSMAALAFDTVEQDYSKAQIRTKTKIVKKNAYWAKKGFKQYIRQKPIVQGVEKNLDSTLITDIEYAATFGTKVKKNGSQILIGFDDLGTINTTLNNGSSSGELGTIESFSSSDNTSYEILGKLAIFFPWIGSLRSVQTLYITDYNIEIKEDGAYIKGNYGAWPKWLLKNEVLNYSDAYARGRFNIKLSK